MDVAILDFSKAFETVPHKRLLGKLEMYRISGKAHSWISSFLTGRKQSVVVDRAHSPEKDVQSGGPQGTVLGPLLVLLHTPHQRHSGSNRPRDKMQTLCG